MLALVVVLFVAVSIAVAAGIGGQQKLTTDSAMDRAGAAALAATGGGRVTESEVSDDKQGYEIEVTLDNGNKVEVRLDAKFKVISQEADDDNDENEREDGPDVH
jgi:uncharacterized membrane protein YkoI